MAQRIMGQGRYHGIVQKVAEVQAKLSQESCNNSSKKLAKGDFTLDDFRKHFEMNGANGRHARPDRTDTGE